MALFLFDENGKGSCSVDFLIVGQFFHSFASFFFMTEALRTSKREMAVATRGNYLN